MPVLFFGLMVAALSGCTLAESRAGASGVASESAVRDAVARFARGDNDQRVDVLEAVLHPTFTMSTVMEGEVRTFTREVYLGGIADKKFGGHFKELTVDAVHIHEDTASVHARLAGGGLAFSHLLHLGRVGDEWKLVHSMVHMRPTP